MPHAKAFSPHSLYRICLVSVNNHVNTIAEERSKKCSHYRLLKKNAGTAFCSGCLDKSQNQQPICLPCRISTDLLGDPITMDPPFDIAYQYYLFVHEDISEISLRKYYIKNSGFYRAILALLGKRCKNIKSLTLESSTDLFFTYKSTKSINDFLLKCCGTLTYLNLTDNQCIDDTSLFIISDNAANLIELNLWRCSKVSDKGLRYLCGLENAKGCLNIEVLILYRISESHSQIPENAIILILKHLKKLKSLNEYPPYRYCKLGAKVLKDICGADIVLPNFSELDIAALLLEDDRPLTIDHIVNTFPNLTSLSLRVRNGLNINDISKFKKLKKLNLNKHWGSIMTFDQCLNLFKNIGTDLTYLNLNVLDAIDVSAVIVFCPNLEYLSLKSDDRREIGIQSNYTHLFTPSTCSSLIEIRLVSCFLDYQYVCEETLTRMLKNAKKLEKLSLDAVDAFNEQVVNDIVSENKFENLVGLWIRKCRFFNSHALFSFVTLDNGLRAIDITHCKVREYDWVDDYARENNLDVRIFKTGLEYV